MDMNKYKIDRLIKYITEQGNILLHKNFVRYNEIMAERNEPLMPEFENDKLFPNYDEGKIFLTDDVATSEYRFKIENGQFVIEYFQLNKATGELELDTTVTLDDETYENDVFEVMNDKCLFG